MSLVRPDGGTAVAEAEYLGVSRELRVDGGNMDLIIHDGTTQGGIRVINRDNGDARYQGKSDELTGIGADFLPEQRGFMTRRGPGDYRIRKITVNTQGLTVTNPDGYAGNPEVALADTIAGDRTFLGDISIQGVTEIIGGLNADTSGTHVGPQVGNVTGDVVGNLNGNSTGTHNGASVGSIDVRGQAALFDDNQIPAAKIAGLGAFIVGAGVPVGGIIMWAGSVSAIPANYLLCDGGGGTPNLVDRFVRGADAGSVGDVGGADTHDHTVTVAGSGSHDHLDVVGGHALTVLEMPAHTHDIQLSGSAGVANIPLEGTGSALVGATASAGGGNTHTHSIAPGADGTHTHTATVDSVSNIPAYYALAYIMRIA